MFVLLWLIFFISENLIEGLSDYQSHICLFTVHHKDIKNIMSWLIPNWFPLLIGNIAFEKMTGLDYRGTTFRSIANISLSECYNYCLDDEGCKAGAFSFVINPLAPVQETLCHLQNETEASNPMTAPQRAINMYYFVKLQIRSGNEVNVFVLTIDVLCSAVLKVL